MKANVEFDDITKDLTDVDRDRVNAAIDITGRTGASSVMLEEQDDGRWIATAQYDRLGGSWRGEAESAPAAADLMVSGILEGGKCVHCGRTTTVKPQTFYDRSQKCVWTRERNSWESSC